MMLWKNRNKKVGLCVMVVVSCLVLAGIWAVLATPETALAKKPGGGGDAGVAPVCIVFEAGGGIQSDDGTPYCDDKQLKVEAIMSQDGHVSLQPNTGRGEGRTLEVYTNIDPVNPLEGWRFLVGGWNENFDMRAMGIGEEYIRDDVNLRINTNAPDGNGNVWWLIFETDFERWGITGEGSTYATVTRTAADTWKVKIDADDQAVRVIQKKVGKKTQFEYGGVVTVPPFTATVTLN